MEFSKKICAIAPSLTLKIDAAFKKMKAEGLDVVGFGAGEPDFDTPAYIKAAAVEALQKGLTKYTPASGTPAIKEAVCARMARKYGLEYDPACVVVSNGAKHSLFNAFAAILNPGDEVIIPSPYWVTYPELVKISDGVPVFVDAPEENGFTPKIEDIAAAVTEKTKAIIVNNPSNPCGCVYPRKLLEEIATLARERDFMIVSDEIYDELVYCGEFTSIPTLSADAKERTILVNGVSKSYAMTGWRIGYTISTPALAKIMGSLQSHATSNPCSIAQYAAAAALNGPQEELAAMVKEFDKRRLVIHELISQIPEVSSRLPEGAFYTMLNISRVIGKRFLGKEIKGSVDFAQYLLEEELTAVVPGAAFGADEFVRLSYATSEENISKGLARIASFCAKLN